MERYLLEVIQGKRQGLVPATIHSLFYFLSLLYQKGVSLRNLAFDKKWLKTSPSGAPLTLSIGNITVGGTGKTPFTEFLAREFSHKAQVAILSRGYRSQAERLATPLFLSRGVAPLYPPEYAGDEPYLLARALPQALVIVGKDRVKAAEMAVEAKAQVVILDDGFQHRYLERDLDILLLDGEDPFGGHRFLPYGLLRDEVESLRRAHLIILNKLPHGHCFEEMKKNLRLYSEALVVGASLHVKQIVLRGEVIPSIAHKRVALFCGIAKPERFVKTMESLGAIVVHTKFAKDHHPFNEGMLREFVEESVARGAEALFCTEKDQVKLPHHLDLSLPLGWLKVEMRIDHGESEWKAFIKKAKLLMDSKSFLG